MQSTSLRGEFRHFRCCTWRPGGDREAQVPGRTGTRLALRLYSQLIRTRLMGEAEEQTRLKMPFNRCEGRRLCVR